MRPRIDRQALGRAAEDAAAAYLVERGLTILLRNFRCRLGELDIVARTADRVLVIAEVRLRSDARRGGSPASVDGHKQRRLLLATRWLLGNQPALARLPVRFDVLAIDGSGEITWIKQAFDAR
jgi:putative endonuclease